MWLLAHASESQVRLQVGADQTGSKHTGDSRNRGKGGHWRGPSQRRTVAGVEMRTFGEKHVAAEKARFAPAFALARVIRAMAPAWLPVSGNSSRRWRASTDWR